MDDSCHAFNMTYDRCCTKRKISRILKTLEAMLGCRPHCNHPFAQCFFLSFFNSTITFLMVSLTQFFGQINLSATNEPLLSYLVMANFFKNLLDFFFQSASCDNNKTNIQRKTFGLIKPNHRNYQGWPLTFYRETRNFARKVNGKSHFGLDWMRKIPNSRPDFPTGILLVY